MQASPGPSTPPDASALQGWVLVSCAWLSVIGSGMLAPVLPRMMAAFASQPHLNLLISLTATLPALFVAFLALPFGILGDRVGHQRVLFWATVTYSVFGTAPLLLQTLPEIVFSRALVGVAEAAIMTCSTTLIGDYFAPERRARYLSLQTGTAPIAAIIVIAMGGALGAAGWRVPFFGYGFAILLVPLTGLLLREPKRSDLRQSAYERHGSNGLRVPPGPALTAPAIRWGQLFWICLITVFAMTAFMVTVIQLGFLLTERGLIAPQRIGLWSSIASLATPLGALAFSVLRWRTVPKVAMSFALFSAGFLGMSVLPGWQAAVVGAVIANFGAGMILPTLITWAIATLPASHRGIGTGLWMAADFLGQFLSPLVVLLLKIVTGSLSNAILFYAVACAIAGIGAMVCVARPAMRPERAIS